MGLQGLTFTTVFPGQTHPSGIAWFAESVTWHPTHARKFLNPMGELGCSYAFTDNISMLMSVAMWAKNLDRNPDTEIQAIECDSAGWYRIQQQKRNNYPGKDGTWPTPRVWAVTIAAATMGWVQKTSEAQWCIARHITGGDMEFLESVEYSTFGLKQHWSKGRITNPQGVTVDQIQKLITYDPTFCNKPVTRAYIG